MMHFAIGAPGASPRLIIMTADQDTAQVQQRAGEVTLPVDGVGDYLIGADGASIAPRIRSAEEAWATVRARRAALLAACDWTQMADQPAATRDAWAPYRQALRDITTQSDPGAVTWPAAPTTTPAQE